MRCKRRACWYQPPKVSDEGRAPAGETGRSPQAWRGPLGRSRVSSWRGRAAPPGEGSRTQC
eukprot:9770213-Alexandrium_andersonii.AAC.1